jgi:hypothetical protein
MLCPVIYGLFVIGVGKNGGYPVLSLDFRQMPRVSI